MVTTDGLALNDALLGPRIRRETAAAYPNAAGIAIWVPAVRRPARQNPQRGEHLLGGKSGGENVVSPEPQLGCSPSAGAFLAVPRT